MIYLRLADLLNYWSFEHQSSNYNLCFLSEEKLFSLIVDLHKTIFAAFISCLVRNPEKTKLNGEQTIFCFPDYSNFLDTLYIEMKINKREIW